MVLLAATHVTEPIDRSVSIRSLAKGFRDEQSIIWQNAKLRTLSFLGFAYSATQLSLSAFAVVTLVHDGGWSLLAAGSVAAVMQFAGAFGRIFWGVVADRVGGGFKTLALLGLLIGLGFASLFFVVDMTSYMQVVVLIILGMTTIGWNGVLLAEVAHNAPEGRIGAITGGVLVYTFIGVIVGPSSFASLYMVTGHYGASFLVFSLLGFFGMVAACRSHRAAKR
jgi:nitrate/nitrite transporter NarK